MLGLLQNTKRQRILIKQIIIIELILK